MRWIYVVSAQRLKQVLIITAAILMAAGIGYAEQDTMSAFAGGSQAPQAIYKVDTKEKKIALTFDISWGESRTVPILDILKAKNVTKSTIFLSSPWSQRHPEIVKRIKEDGFEIGSHGHKHDNYSKYTDEEIRSQIGKADTILTEMTGKKPNLIRMPNGDFDKRVLQIAGDMGYTVIQWDTDSKDWTNPGTENIINNVLSKAHPGDIILMHASDSCKETHLALPVIIDKLRQQGYEFVTVSELIAGTDMKSKEIN
ncbi:polysaccharide deacetylase family sporulation protein PdaB [Brevibacillus centrosporus]|jgi:polysaccharide deacetylase family sporulation protein PdaB|uniref:Polysaccharide deacetylase family sporulation protein PdaB n=1 Tax=Brevibacillus centrosporus TaxID=54910 RepID=A0A1I4DZS2_9BACL|nr:polysaccharide deacetylase family sporulation protein PdaB [Brevibacillus centrosporus]MEC2132026.1 polysaccharide deacetylase family sporulation protein PdaB [Brevibacillus centrosporus]MED4912100.1 polysaccharide deacetylase family sporulation protein PdaB [Brevibacillus centrosporus]RNB66083.1 polysaccharide deacetylase family sporulation protein PdaB [Brevibacillus centrosporus]SFK97767.1 polysaccharide deacetylase family sporulation protein PdaB [Brevibacillus centrosporus]GED32939.1 p